MREDGDAIRIGALTRHHQLETSPVIAAHFPVLAEAMTHVAHLAIRNRGTIGGSLSHADPAAELPMMAMLLDAEIARRVGDGNADGRGARFLSRTRSRRRSSEDEIVTEIVLPKLPPDTGWGFEEVARRSGDFALAAVGGDADAVPDGTIAQARIAMTGVGDDARGACREAEALLTGSASSRASIDAVVEAVRARRRARTPTCTPRPTTGGIWSACWPAQALAAAWRARSAA